MSNEIITLDSEFDEARTKLDEVLVKSYWSENGELIYILHDHVSLEDYALLIKFVLETRGEIEHGFVGKVCHSSNQEERIPFQYVPGANEFRNEYK